MREWEEFRPVKLPPPNQDALISLQREVARLRSLQRIGVRDKWKPLPHQTPPSGKWYGWLLLGGRGCGKTAAATAYLDKHMNGPPCIDGPAPHWASIIAPTLGDAVTSCYAGPSGVRSLNPAVKLTGTTGGSLLRWPNGSECKLFGASSPEDVDRLRSGGNRCFALLEEMSSWRYLNDCWDHMRFGLRQGPWPHWVGATTPKPRTLIRDFDAGKIQGVILSHAETNDNPHLEELVRAALYDTYEGTSLGSQELHGKLILSDPNALWRLETIARNRLRELDRELDRITVGVDPSGGAGEQGIVVVGRAYESVLDRRGARKRAHGYVLADRTCRLMPAGWGARAVNAATEFDADDIVVETNFGGDMAVATLRTAADQLGVSIPIRTVVASRGKRARAEPVAALSDTNHWHHVGTFDELEGQQCTWVPGVSDYSPDRLDAMVWGAWHMKIVNTMRGQVTGTFGGALAGQSIGYTHTVS